jgi:HD-like signal output (HDOD) protein
VVTDAFIGGLLHDIGHVILVGQKGEQYRDILGLAEHDAVFVVQAEQKILSVTHAEIGAYLLMCLGFPMSIIEIVAYHHQLDQQLDTSFSGLTAVHVADSHIADTDNSSCRLGSAVAADYLAQAGCSEKLVLWENVLTN